MRIGIISDTHSYFDPSISTYFKECDEIWHGGDIGDISVLEKLKEIAPTVAVFGNIDTNEVCQILPENQLIERGGLKILITHIAGKLPRYNARVQKLIASEKPNILVCGHSHILKVQPDRTNNLLFINPGAAGLQGFHKMKTLLRMDIQEGQPKNLEVVELGLRGKI